MIGDSALRILVVLFAGAGAWLWSLDPNPGARRLARLRGLRGGRFWVRRRPARPTRSMAAEMPPALDLLAACLSAGAMLDSALAAVAVAFDGPIGAVLADVARLTALGAPPEDAWSAALRDQRWAPVARAAIRAHHSGAALTDVLNRAASDLRRSPQPISSAR